MIQTIRIGHLLREAVAAPYRNLVTRPTGAAVRTRIEETLARSRCLTALLDFSEIELVDLSCADEVVAKLLLAGRDVCFFVLQGLREDQHEAIDHVLTHHRLAVAAVPQDKGEPRLLGWVPSDEREAFACICDRGPLGVGDLARSHGLAGNPESRRSSQSCRPPAGASGRRGVSPSSHGMSRRQGFSTTAIHGIPQRRPDWSPVAPAIQQSSTFTNPVGSDEEVLYSRYGNNPNQLALAKKYALLEGTEDAIFVASGMGATALAHLAVLRPGDHLISSSWIYGGTQHLFDQELARFGIDVTYVNPEQPRHWRKAVRKATRAIFVESPTNPLMRVIDLGPIAYAAEEEGLALLVDATFASPFNFQADRARRRRGHHQRDQVPQRSQRRDRRRRCGLHLTGGGGEPPDAPLGSGDRSPCRLAHRSRNAHARRPDGTAQRQRSRRGQLGRDPGGHLAGALPRASLSPRSRVRQEGAAWIQRHGGARAQGRRQSGGAVPQAAQDDRPRAQSGAESRHWSRNRGSRRTRAWAPRAGQRSGFPTGSCG